MKASLIDRGKYYRGLLVLIGRDRIVDRRERALMLQFGKMLDFDVRFCETAIAELPDNKHIDDEVILFDESAMVECFLRDALRLALIDGEIHSRELSWLKKIARSNNMTDAWLDRECRRIQKEALTEATPESFEIHQYI